MDDFARTASGLLLALLSAVMTGSFSLPMKKTTRWSWEATWLVWSVCALFIIPWTIAIMTVHDVFGVFSHAAMSDVILVFTFGLCWGLGAVFFGQSISIIGISLAFAICIGLATGLGALIPMVKNLSVFQTTAGLYSLAGIAIIVLGVSVCALAGHRKDKQLRAKLDTDKALSGKGDTQAANSMIYGLILATLGGIFSSMLNLAFNFSQSIKDAAFAAGASNSSAADPVWALTLFGGLIVNAAYCSFLLTRNHTWPDYQKPGTGSYWFLAALMGAIWMPSIALYGRAAVMMGSLGSSAGWGLYMGVVIIVSNVWGFITAEWRGVRGAPVKLMIVGSVLLLLAISLIGYATTMK